MVHQNLESSHQTHPEVHHGHDNTNHQARHEAAHHLTGEHGVDHKNLSKLPTNHAAEAAIPKMKLHDSSKEAAASKPAKGRIEAPQAHQEQAPEAAKPADAAKPVDAAKPDATKSTEPSAAQKMVAEEMVSDLQKKDLQGQLSKQTTTDIGALGADAAKNGGTEGLKQFNDGMSKAFDKAQNDAGIPPSWQKKFEAGSDTGKWQDFSISKGNVKDTAGFSHPEIPSQSAAPAQAPVEKSNEYFPGS